MGKYLLPYNKKSGKSLSRPFNYSDMDSVPMGRHIGPPDFVGVASGKAGTSWWYKLLIEHPSVTPNRLNRKELNYFIHFAYNGIDSNAIEKYRNAFATPKNSICGEWSPGYLNFPFAIDYLAAAVPETKILAIVRNPVDRILSAQNQQLSKRAGMLGLKGNRLYIFQKFSIFPNVLFMSFLYNPFKRLLRHFHRSQILLLQYEKCRIEPEEEIKKTYSFLNIDEQFVPPSLRKPVNKKPYLIPRLDENARKRLAEYFFDDVMAFLQLFPEIDISLWKDFDSKNS